MWQTRRRRFRILSFKKKSSVQQLTAEIVLVLLSIEGFSAALKLRSQKVAFVIFLQNKIDKMYICIISKFLILFFLF